MNEHIIDQLIPLICIVSLVGIAAWLVVTWMKVRHGYPLTDGWGRPVHPKANDETTERVRLLTQENAQLRAELGSIKDRLGNVERIVTDGNPMLDREIEQLRFKAN